VPGPLRAFFLRVRAKRGQHVAAVATARKLVVLIWHLLHKKENYAWARPALPTVTSAASGSVTKAMPSKNLSPSLAQPSFRPTSI
jgi:hypothetical protein